ncbi:unnamed protein product [Phytophthora lilii]|uniref:Unnamed protein product n=1 Tax=Phytophthora lilii TaxID=2077276 RepID=A0A9W6WZK2_9STRA|nr:unnamed protein product [Phytophthora lilii]
MLRCLTRAKVPRTGMHLLSLLRALPALRALRFWDYPYWTPEDDAPEDEEPAINVAAVLQLLPSLQELNVADADVTLAELLDMAAQPPPNELQPVGWNLRALDLAETDVVDLAPLVVLPQLQSLSVRRTNVATLAVLEALPELHVLDVSETRVVEFSALKALQQLETLDMSKNWVTTNLSVLQHLPALRSLKATNIGASDSLELRLKCPELEILHLQNTRLTDLEFARELPNLTFLDIRWTHVGDRRPLAALASLEQLLLDTRERGEPTGDTADPPLPVPPANYEWLGCLHKLKKLRMYKHNYQDDIADVLREDVEERGQTVVSTRGLTIPQTHRVPSSFLRYVSREGALSSLELPPLTDYSPLTLLGPTLRHLRLQQWCADDLAQIVALNDMPALTRLSMSLPPTAQVMDLLPLEGFVQLTQLELLDVLFEDLAPLGALVKLEKLVLSLPDRGKRQLARRHKDHQTSFEFLSQLTQLQELSLAGRVDFKDATLLSGMLKMRRLWLNATKVEDAAPLATLTRLEMLDLGVTPVTTVEGIPQLLELQSIWIPEPALARPPSLTDSKPSIAHAENASEQQDCVARRRAASVTPEVETHKPGTAAQAFAMGSPQPSNEALSMPIRNAGRSHSLHECPDLSIAKSADERLHFLFSGGGWLMVYMYGVCKALRELKVDENAKFIGTSAGCLSIVSLVLNSDFDEICDSVINDYVSAAHASWKNPFQMRDYLVDAVTRHGKVNNIDKLHGKVTIVGAAVQAGGEYVIDGGLLDNQPLFEGDIRTITVSPNVFTGADIHPSRYVPPWWSMYKREMQWLYELGYEDALTWCVREGLPGSANIAVPTKAAQFAGEWKTIVGQVVGYRSIEDAVVAVAGSFAAGGDHHLQRDSVRDADLEARGDSYCSAGPHDHRLGRRGFEHAAGFDVAGSALRAGFHGGVLRSLDGSALLRLKEAVQTSEQWRELQGAIIALEKNSTARTQSAAAQGADEGVVRLPFE